MKWCASAITKYMEDEYDEFGMNGVSGWNNIASKKSLPGEYRGCQHEEDLHCKLREDLLCSIGRCLGRALCQPVVLDRSLRSYVRKVWITASLEGRCIRKIM